MMGNFQNWVPGTPNEREARGQETFKDKKTPNIGRTIQ